MNELNPPTRSQGDLSTEELLASAQTLHPTVPLGSRDTIPTWAEILGNSRLKQTLQAFVSQPHDPRNHILVYGANRSAKTSTIHLALQAKFCRRRDASLNPCQGCPSCQRWLSGAGFRNGRYFNGTESFEYRGIDCTDPHGFDEESLLSHRDWDCPLILFLDEVASPAFRPIIPRLYKPMTELPITILACAVRIKAIRDPKTGKLKPGLPADFRFRFPHIEKTTGAAAPDFIAWLGKQCELRSVQVDEPSTLELIREKSLSVPGQALRLLQRAAFLRAAVTRSFVEDFRWDAE